MITPEDEMRINEKIAEIEAVAKELPGVIIIHQLPGFILRYMSPLGLRLLEVDWESVKGMSGEEYHARFFNEEFAKFSLPLLVQLVEENSDNDISYFQQVRTSKDREWDWYMSITKLLLRDSENRPLLAITTAMKIDPEHVFTAKATKLLEENRFLRDNYDRFSKLTKREKEILRLIALGKTALEMAKELSISPATAETHRKKIKQKLSAGNSYDLAMYARAFDLI